MSVIVFTDIDDTLMSTGRKVSPELRVASGAMGKSGKPFSFMTQAHVDLYERLCAMSSELPVAVTARDQKGLARVHLQFNPQAVVDFGATVINAQGEICHLWEAQLSAQQDPLLEQKIYRVVDKVLLNLDVPLCEIRRNAAGMLAFINLRSEDQEQYRVMETLFERALQREQLPHSVLLHKTGRDIAIMPAYINKGAAVRHLVAMNGWADRTLMGCADSLSDVSFLKHMHFSVVPSDSRAMTSLAHIAQASGAIE